jgi:hypothetical protein
MEVSGRFDIADHHQPSPAQHSHMVQPGLTATAAAMPCRLRSRQQLLLPAWLLSR